MKKIGIITTVIYVCFICWLLGDRFFQLTTMPLNEIGDFCAGVFGPITFFWLILGFIMQTEELKQSSEALQLQARELKNSVEQQKEMVKLSQHQFERELEKDRAREENESLNAQPIFDFVSSGPFSNSGGKVTYGFKLRNSGSSITEVNILLPSGYDLDCSKFNIWDSGVVKNFGLSFQNSNLNLELLFEISFVDGQHLNKKDEYILEVRGTGTDKLSWRKNG